MTEPSALVAGEALIDFVPAADGPLDDVETFTRRAGGAPATVAAGLATLGARTVFWTRVGDDPFGDLLTAKLTEAGVDDALVSRDGEADTGLAFLERDGDERSFTFVRDGAADTRLQHGAVSDERLDAVEWVHVSGFALSAEPTRSALLELAERANDRGCTVSVDPNVRPDAWTNLTELQTVTGWLLDAADLVFATPGELRALGFDGTDREALATAVTAQGPNTVVLTLGEEGAYAGTTPSSRYHGPVAHEGFDVSEVDDTGAGDAFVAGAISALIDGASLSRAVAVGNATGALATTTVGGIDAVPDRAAVATLLADSE